MPSVEDYVGRYGLKAILSESLLAAMRLEQRKAGEHLYRRGEPFHNLLFLVEGRAKVYSQMENGSSLLVRFYRPFDILGDVELFSFDTCRLDVVGLSETSCLSLEAEAIRRNLAANATFLAWLCGRLGSKLAEFNTTAAVNLRYPVENRLASYLLAVEEAGEGREGLGTDDLGELADILGTSYRQLSRVVRQFRDQGILDETRGRIRLLARAKLEPLAKDLYH